MPFQLRFDNHRNKATLSTVRCLGLFYGGFFSSVKALVPNQMCKGLVGGLLCLDHNSYKILYVSFQSGRHYFVAPMLRKFNISIPEPSQRSARNGADHYHVKQFVNNSFASNIWTRITSKSLFFVVRLFYFSLHWLHCYALIRSFDVCKETKRPVFACFYEIRTFTTTVSFIVPTTQFHHCNN